MDNKEQCRAEFEAWAEREGYASDGEYLYPFDLMHKAWVAAWNRRAPAPQAVQPRQSLLHAAINCAHSIDANTIKLHRDPKLEGNALSQLGDRLESATSPAPAVVQMTDEQIDEILENESYAGRNPNGRLTALPLGVECLRTLFRRAIAAASLAKEIKAREREAHARIEKTEREGLIEFGTTLQKLGARAAD